MFAKLNAILGEYDMDERIVARNVPTWAALNDRHDVLSAELVLSLMRAYGEHAMADLYERDETAFEARLDACLRAVDEHTV